MLWSVVVALLFIAVFTMVALSMAASGYTMVSLLLLAVLGIVLEDMSIK